ncbi:MAG TPA: hypothetical protein VGS08_04750 [Candidatus Saccharimonadales bacterium]|nr:hypothetical protein [Candidatus Saccharimonadales bacterium]
MTGRRNVLAQPTKHLIDTYFPNTFTSIEYTSFYGRTPRSKADVCREIGAGTLIDDHLHHAELVAGCSVLVLLFGDYPWNQKNDLPLNIRRVKDWAAVAKLLLPPAPP